MPELSEQDRTIVCEALRRYAAECLKGATQLTRMGGERNQKEADEWARKSSRCFAIVDELDPDTSAELARASR